METKQQMRERLANPVKFEHPTGLYVEGRDPHGVLATTPAVQEGEIELLLGEVADIKNFTFCRLLLSPTQRGDARASARHMLQSGTTKTLRRARRLRRFHP